MGTVFVPWFDLLDNVRRWTGLALDRAGLDPIETPSRVLAEMPGARLRAYHSIAGSSGPVLLIVPAPIKRSYIWDLLPSVSVVRHCLQRGVRVFLLEWLDPGREEDELGLMDYADRLLRAAVNPIAAETGEANPMLAGHSLGGTLATIFATLHPECVRALVLLEAPIAFGEHGGPLARAVAAAPSAQVLREAATPVPGSFIALLSVAAVPEAFLWQRWADLVASLADPEALSIHTHVLRWMLDEFAQPGRLFDEVIEGLYREDRFVRGTLEIGDRRTGIAGLRCPVLAVVAPSGQVVAPESTLSALTIRPGLPFRLLQYEGSRGAVLQHLGPLVSPAAHAHLWPEILEWLAVRWSEREPGPGS